MIDELSGGRLTIYNNFLLVAAAQRPRVEEILKSMGASANWSRAVSAVEPFNGSSNDSGETAVWNVFFQNVEPDQLQLALDEAQ